MSQEQFESRIRRVEDSVALREPDRMPIIPMISGLPFFLSEDGTTMRDAWYDYPRAEQAYLRYHERYQPDIAACSYTSGRANEIAESNMIDWPGRPSTKVAPTSTHQVIEREFMTPDEYPEMIGDFTGFMLRKYIPRAFPGLSGLQSIGFVPSIVLSTQPLSGLYAPAALEAYDKLRQIAEEDGKAAAATAATNEKLTAMGFPPYMTGAGEVPFDIISDYYRGTVGMFEDQIERPEMIAQACDMLADIQIASYAYFDFVPMPVKRVFFPLHKGMDGFINDEQYRTLYWKPFEKILSALIEKGVTPIIYTEGPYKTRLSVIEESLSALPRGKCILHFEEAGDFAALKKRFDGIVCLSGGMRTYLLEWGTVEQVVDQVKYLVDHCAPGGGYLFNTGAIIENAKRENIDAMFETARQYGRK